MEKYNKALDLSFVLAYFQCDVFVMAGIALS